MAAVEPRYASDYDDRTTVAVRSVLVEIRQVLGSYKGKFAVIDKWQQDAWLSALGLR